MALVYHAILLRRLRDWQRLLAHPFTRKNLEITTL